MKKFTPYLLIASFIIGLVFTPKASAASYSPTYSLGNTSLNAVLINQYTVDYDIDSTDTNVPHGNYNVYTYSCDLLPSVTLSGDGYINGYGMFQIVCYPSIPSGMSFGGRTISFTPVTGNGIYASITDARSSSQTYFWGRIMCDNVFGNMGLQGLGTVNYTFTLYATATPTNVPDPPQYISMGQLGMNAVGNNSFTITPEPQDMGLAHIIATAINNGDFNDNIAEMVDMLTLIKDNNTTYYTNILTALNTENGWLEEIFNELDTADNIWWPSVSNNTSLTAGRLSTLLSDLATYNSSFYANYGNKVLQLLGKLADMSASEQTQAAAMQSEYAAISAKADEQAAQMNPVKPTFSANQFDLNSTVDTTQRQNFSGLIGMILGNTFFVKLMLILMTCAIAGFALYGRKST